MYLSSFVDAFLFSLIFVDTRDKNLLLKVDTKDKNVLQNVDTRDTFFETLETEKECHPDQPQRHAPLKPIVSN